MLAMAHLVECSRKLNGHGDYICNYNVKAGNATPLEEAYSLSFTGQKRCTVVWHFQDTKYLLLRQGESSCEQIDGLKIKSKR